MCNFQENRHTVFILFGTQAYKTEHIQLPRYNNCLLSRLPVSLPYRLSWQRLSIVVVAASYLESAWSTTGVLPATIPRKEQYAPYQQDPRMLKRLISRMWGISLLSSELGGGLRSRLSEITWRMAC